MKLAVIAAIAALIAMGPTLGRPIVTPHFVILKGQCFYPADPPVYHERRLDCFSAVLSAGREPMDVLVQFASHSNGIYGFAGPVSGDEMTVKRLYLPGPKVVAAESGNCKFFYDREDISGVTCVGRTREAIFAANFEVGDDHAD